MLLTQTTLMKLTKTYLTESAKQDADHKLLNNLRKFAIEAKSKRDKIESGDMVAVIKCKGDRIYLGTSLSMVDGKPMVMGVDIDSAVMSPIDIFNDAAEFFLLEPIGDFKEVNPNRLHIASSLLEEGVFGELVFNNDVYRISSVAGISFSRIVIGVNRDCAKADIKAFNISSLNDFDFEIIEL